MKNEDGRTMEKLKIVSIKENEKSQSADFGNINVQKCPLNIR